MKRPYTDDEIFAICHRLILCHYITLRLRALVTDTELRSAENKGGDVLTDIQFSFYSEAMIFNLGAIISFFYTNEDQEFLSRLSLNKNQLKDLYDLRAVPAHILGLEEG